MPRQGGECSVMLSYLMDSGWPGFLEARCFLWALLCPCLSLLICRMGDSEPQLSQPSQLCCPVPRSEAGHRDPVRRGWMHSKDLGKLSANIQIQQPKPVPLCFLLQGGLGVTMRGVERRKSCIGACMEFWASCPSSLDLSLLICEMGKTACHSKSDHTWGSVGTSLPSPYPV